ncbi:MAG: DpnD/PcfM family protein [Synergistaceae bacterium]|nr:DpnD/PcfM family protein [Synergistaceae bacterium]
MIYRVAVTEIYRKVVSVEARSEREAHQRAWDAWNNTEIILSMNDFDGAEMSVLGEGHETDGE